MFLPIKYVSNKRSRVIEGITISGEQENTPSVGIKHSRDKTRPRVKHLSAPVPRPPNAVVIRRCMFSDRKKKTKAKTDVTRDERVACLPARLTALLGGLAVGVVFVSFHVEAI